MTPAWKHLNLDHSLTTEQQTIRQPLNDSYQSLKIHHDPIQKLVHNIQCEFSRSNTSLDVDAIWHILEQYKSYPADWSRYAFYDTNKYKRNLVAECEKFNVMIICWGSDVKSCIHDHSGSHCFMKVLDGQLIESRFAWPSNTTTISSEEITSCDEMSDDDCQNDNEMCLISENKMNMDDVFYINDKVGLHRVENPNPNKTAASLHVYIPPYRECKAFDQKTGKAQDCRLKFYSKCGRIVREDEDV